MVSVETMAASSHCWQHHKRVLRKTCAPEEKYSASDMARVTSDLMRLPIAGSPEATTAASKERDSAAFDEVSRGHPPASHSAATCQAYCRSLEPQPLHPHNAHHIIWATLTLLKLPCPFLQYSPRRSCFLNQARQRRLHIIFWLRSSGNLWRGNTQT